MANPTRGWRRVRLAAVVVALVLCAAFNALWIFEDSLKPQDWQALVTWVNLLFLTLAFTAIAIVARWRRQTSRLRRAAQSLELRLGDFEREARVLETIQSVSTAFLAKVHIQPLLRQMSEAAHQILDADATVVELVGEPGVFEPITLASGTVQVVLGQGVHDEVVGQGKSILLNNLGEHPRYADLARQGLRSMLIAPFKHGEHVLGLIGAFMSTERSFGGHDLRVLHTFATHTSLLLESAALLDAVRRLSLRAASDQVDDLRHLRDRLSIERELADREYAVARRIQAELLPHAFPPLRESALDALMLPAREVGGDFYDVIPLGDGAWGIVVADVSGKGIPAALVMVMTRVLLRAASARPSPREALLEVNRELFEQTTGDVFVSIFYGVWDDAARTLRYTNAGHEPPLLVHGQAASFLPRGGVALGAYRDIDVILTEATLELASGDALLLYTDGVREAMNRQGLMYGLERLSAVAVRAVAERQPLVAALRDDLNRFVTHAEQHDDITLLALQGR